MKVNDSLLAINWKFLFLFHQEINELVSKQSSYFACLYYLFQDSLKMITWEACRSLQWYLKIIWRKADSSSLESVCLLAGGLCETWLLNERQILKALRECLMITATVYWRSVKVLGFHMVLSSQLILHSRINWPNSIGQMELSKIQKFSQSHLMIDSEIGFR